MRFSGLWAGYSMGQADNIRRAISKKKQKIIDAERKTFVYGDREQKIDGCYRSGRTRGGGAVDLRRNCGFRQLRLQQGPRGVLCRGRLPDGLPQVPLSKAVHGGADDLRSGLCDQNLRLYRRVPGAGNPGSAAGHQPFRGLLHRRGPTPSASASAR